MKNNMLNAVKTAKNQVKKVNEQVKKTSDKVNDTITNIGDVNDDGKLNLKDVTFVISSKKAENELKTLRPIFKDDISSTYSIINIVDEDKKRRESDICKGAVGYLTKLNQMDMINIYEENVEILNAQFKPKLSKGVYILNPYQDNFYIKHDEYFQFLKKACVGELEHIAHLLGAKYFKVTFAENTSNSTKSSGNVQVGAAKIAKGKNETSSSSFEYSNTEIAAELEFDGNEVPSVPELNYFEHDTDIEKLITMRTNPATENSIKSKNYVFSFNSLSDISESMATEVDVALKQYAANAKTSFSRSKKSAKNTVLEYIIKF